MKPEDLPHKVATYLMLLASAEILAPRHGQQGWAFARLGPILDEECNRYRVARAEIVLGAAQDLEYHGIEPTPIVDPLGDAA